MLRLAEEHLAKPLALGNVLKCRAGIGDADEVASGQMLADGLAHALHEVLQQDVGLERRARLARHDEQCPPEIHRAFRRGDLRRIGGVQHVQLGKAP